MIVSTVKINDDNKNQIPLHIPEINVEAYSRVASPAMSKSCDANIFIFIDCEKSQFVRNEICIAGLNGQATGG